MKKILVIEDDLNILKVITSKLEFLGYEVIQAEDGLEGLAGLEQNPDLIWLDLYLPNMGGIEFLNKIGGIKQYEKIPIVIVSVSRSRVEESKLISIPNALRYFVKSGTTLDQIVEEIERIFGRNRGLRKTKKSQT